MQADLQATKAESARTMSELATRNTELETKRRLLQEEVKSPLQFARMCPLGTSVHECTHFAAAAWSQRRIQSSRQDSYMFH